MRRRRAKDGAWARIGHTVPLDYRSVAATAAVSRRITFFVHQVFRQPQGAEGIG